MISRTTGFVHQTRDEFVALPSRSKVAVVAISVFAGLAVGSVATIAAFIPGLGLATGICIPLIVGVIALSVLFAATSTTALFIPLVKAFRTPPASLVQGFLPAPIPPPPPPPAPLVPDFLEAPIPLPPPAPLVQEEALIPFQPKPVRWNVNEMERQLEAHPRRGLLNEFTKTDIDHPLPNGGRFIGSLFKVALPAPLVGSAQRYAYHLVGEFQYAGRRETIQRIFESNRDDTSSEELFRLCFEGLASPRLPLLLEGEKDEEWEIVHSEVQTRDEFEVVSLEDARRAGRGELGLEPAGSCDISPYLAACLQTGGGFDQPQAALLQHLFTETYGNRLINYVFYRYSIDIAKGLTRRDLLKIMTGVATQVTVNDLKGLFEAIKSETGFELRASLKKSNHDLYEEIRRVDRFENLSRLQLAFLYSGFSELPFHLNKESFEDEKDFLFLHDLQAHRVTLSWKSLSKVHPESAYGEYLGKSLAYIESYPGRLFPLPPADFHQSNTPVLYSVIDSIVDRDEGLIAYLLAPLKNEPKKGEGLRLIFRGTKPNRGALAAGASVVRDLDPTGIGRRVYEKHEEALVEMLTRHLTELLPVWISGHSLGGVDTQRFLLSLLERRVKLFNVHCTTYNAPGIEKDINERFHRVLATSPVPPIHLMHHRFFDEERPDVIQTFGEVLLGKGSPSSVDMRLINITIQENFGPTGILQRHGRRTFNEDLCKIRSEVTQIDDPLELDRAMTGSKPSTHVHFARYLLYFGASAAVLLNRKANGAAYEELNGRRGEAS